jgi:HEAT repeat protein
MRWNSHVRHGLWCVAWLLVTTVGQPVIAAVPTLSSSSSSPAEGRGSLTVTGSALWDGTISNELFKDDTADDTDKQKKEGTAKKDEVPEPAATKAPVSPVGPVGPAAPIKPATTKKLPWLTSLADGQRRSVADRKPLLVRVGASWCPPCRKLDAEIEKPSVQAELARWTLVFLDADKAEEEAKELNVTGIPALRIRTILGESIAAQDGFMPAEDLVSWLQKQYEAASAEVDDVLLTNDEPDAAAVVRLVRHFQQRNPALRETAIRRLSAYPQKARVEVARAFAEGKLSGRLAALELLRMWHAPVDNLDPWQPESFTKERVAALNLWAEKYQPPAASGPAKITEQALAEARQDIQRMLKANERDAGAIRNRLAGLGAALLPEVSAGLKSAADDEQRKRLWALRYRLIAADSLALRWPGGLERLADSDPRHRQQAADELARLAASADQPLLVELFGDNDPLVREFSLRGLQNIGGAEATAALSKLLSDPEPNIRAAVLKQLEEKPDRTIVPKLAEYVKTEKDPDLVVHAIRFLREANGAAATRILIPLLHHEIWQVRAEACEALGKMRENNGNFGSVGSAESGESLQAEVYVAMLELLDDTDAFVVSRAVEGLDRVDLAAAVEPLVRAAAKHSELAPKIVEMLARGQKMRVAALPHLRKFRQHADPRVRAAALQGLSELVPDEMGELVSAGLNDPSDKVRIAAAAICYHFMDANREAFAQGLRQQPAFTGPNTGDIAQLVEAAPPPPPTMLGGLATAIEGLFTKPVPKPAERRKAPAEPAEKEPAAGKAADAKPAADSKKVEEHPYEVWLKDYFENQRRPKWAADQIPSLEKMLQSKNAEERLAAAMALVPLGKAQAMLPLVYAIARADSKKFREVAEVLPWLAWEQRQAAFQELRKIAAKSDAGYYLVYEMLKVRDLRTADLLWEMLPGLKAADNLTGEIERGILELYGINYWNVSQGNMTPALAKALRELAVAVKPRAAAGSDLQRLVALSLLTYADPDEARQLAEKLQSDVKVGADLRAGAFQICLVMASAKDGARAAAAGLADKDPDRKKLALQYLVNGAEGLRTLHDSIYIQYSGESRSIRTGQPIVPEPPAGLQAASLVPLLGDSDPATAAYAGYLLALTGDPRGLEPLLRYHQQHAKGDSQTQRLVYRAIAALDDSSQIPVLRKIYTSMQRYEVSEFYWTIRIMTGPDILRFRKQIRDEVGLNQLQ